MIAVKAPHPHGRALAGCGDDCHGHALSSSVAPFTQMTAMTWDAAALECLGLEQVGRGLVRSSRLLRGLPEWQGRKFLKQGTADPAFLVASEQGQSVAYKGQ